MTLGRLNEGGKTGNKEFKLTQVEDYRPLVGDEVVDCILQKAERLKGFHVTNINSTYYVGGVATNTARERFLMTRYSEQYLDLFGSFETCFHYRGDQT